MRTPASSQTLAALALGAAASMPFSVSAQAQRAHGDTVADVDPPAATATRADARPVIDGRPEEPAWSTAPALAGFVQREPFEGRAASERTEIRILYDHDALYVGAWLLDREPSEIVVGEARRDAEPRESDALLIILDTYLDRQNGFVFGTTPAGIEYDGQVTREGQGGGGMARRQQTGSGGGFNKNWDGSWEVATSRDERGWYAEFRIPFSTLRYAGGGAQTWGLNIARRIRRRNEESLWAPVARQFDLYRVSEAGTLVGLEPPPRRLASVTPYVLASGQRDFSAGPDAEYDGAFGADAKLGLTPSLTLDLTYNTDFAQVEVDDEQINLTRFRLFFPEKRPFFLENAGTFAVGTGGEVDLFFSRRIGIHEDTRVPIVGGGRLTGRVGGVTVGLLGIRTDDVAGLDAVTGQPAELVPANTFAVARAIRELPNRSRLGGIFVARLGEASGDRNLTFGVDGRLGIGDALAFDGYVAGTETPGLDGPQRAYSVGGSYTTRDWRIGGSFREVGANFNPEVGFLTRSGYRYTSFRILRAYRFDDVSWFRELRPHISFWNYDDPSGFTETRLIHIDSHFEFADGAFFQLPAINFTRDGLREPFVIYRDDERDVIVPAGTYDNFEWGFEYNTNRSAPLSLEGSIDIGGFYSGRRAGGVSTLSARLGETFTAGLRLSYNDVQLPQGDFTTTLVGLRAAYAFTPRVYLQSLIQYNDQSRLFSSNIRFGWLGTAGTGLFIVYNDMEDAGFFRAPATSIRPLERALTIKFTRQFDLAR